MTVVHLDGHADGPPARCDGRQYLKRKMESLGCECLLPADSGAARQWSRVRAAVRRGEELDADLVVIAAGIRPNAELGRKAGLKVNRGIVVNDYMETSDPDIFAVGECTEHRGQTFGLVAPLFDQAQVLAATITGNTRAGIRGAGAGGEAQDHGRRYFLGWLYR